MCYDTMNDFTTEYHVEYFKHLFITTKDESYCILFLFFSFLYFCFVNTLVIY